MEAINKVVAIVVAAGKGKRMGNDFNKQYILLKNKPIIAHTLEVFEKSNVIDEVILVVGKEEIDFNQEKIIKRYGFQKISKVIAGGRERQDSVYQGLVEVPKDCDIVVIHDGARPFVKEAMLINSIKTAEVKGAAVIGVPVKDTIKKVKDTLEVMETPERKYLWSIQTPQVFRYELIRKAYEAVIGGDILVTDDAMAVEMLGHPVKIVEGSYENIKITTPEDLIMGERILQKEEV
ncbi:2-C-methyl-D-erythritol 4-phosphate cytidylyltransferase [Natronincola ferrireducens]|uniref:2-C-methyl-D-erythritol 4-phosphate cytidylyltransferase n=1 Tax=Natronincola ferrireducens TaxID=393762 RepID=A0A1G9IPL7_9FIRM|nr:2-C-methyl-D-erythritol 4-phosphate cytidylyltransferase [Natronincola ferrireducens]SDL27102.1 2-C-methyl-D-erythritol 4-phosphate cytidylyltransferase [Natronincola ferrireducens]